MLQLFVFFIIWNNMEYFHVNDVTSVHLKLPLHAKSNQIHLITHFSLIFSLQLKHFNANKLVTLEATLVRNYDPLSD